MNVALAKLHPLTRAAGILGALILGVAALPAFAADPFPTKPLRMIVGFPPGGGSDAFARALGQQLGAQLGQQVVIDNRPGANGNIGAEVAAKLPADGYNLLIVSSSQAINQSLYAKLNYDLLKDFAAVGVVGSVPNTVVVKNDLPVKSVAEYIQLAKTKRVTYASSGAGSPEHLAGEIFSKQAGVKMVHVPYKGSGQSVIDLAGGQVDSGFNTLPSVINMSEQGKVRVLAVTTKKRSAINPTIPTVAELGLPNYEMSTWYALVVPAGTPPDIVRKLNEEVNKAVASSEMRTRLLALGADPAEPNTSAQATSYLQSEVAKFRMVVQELGLKVE
jgi:tripartite-type tricarboxylate transporter receptor subunit TctC